jgi:hypothetical protein
MDSNCRSHLNTRLKSFHDVVQTGHRGGTGDQPARAENSNAADQFGWHSDPCGADEQRHAITLQRRSHGAQRLESGSSSQDFAP